MKSLIALGFFVALALGGGVAISIATAPGDWYAALNKPSFNPPGWVFGPVWSALYIMIGVAGWLTFRASATSAAMAFWWAQMALNFSWSPLFFSLQRVDLALIVIIMLLVAIIGFILLSWRSQRLAAWLFAPYAAWVGFATVLNASILALN